MTAPAPGGQPTDPATARAVADLRAEIRDQASQIEALRDHVAHLTAAVDHIEDAAGDLHQVLTGQSQPGDDGEGQAGIDLAELADWVRDHVAQIYTRPVGALRWCATWWEHPEAIVRLESCRRAWGELATQGGAGLSIWHRDHLDPMLAALTSLTGPFRSCEAQPGHDGAKHRLPADLPVRPLPQPGQTNPAEDAAGRPTGGEGRNQDSTTTAPTHRP